MFHLGAHHRNPPEEQREFSLALLKTWINLKQFIKSSKSHFAKVTLQDFTYLHMKLGFYEWTKAHSRKGGGMGLKNHFISIIVFFSIIVLRLIAQPLIIEFM